MAEQTTHGRDSKVRIHFRLGDGSTEDIWCFEEWAGFHISKTEQIIDPFCDHRVTLPNRKTPADYQCPCGPGSSGNCLTGAQP